MKKRAARVITLFILLLFLSPLVGQEIHSLNHWNDIHCTLTSVHFHQEEHHCKLCDFLLPVSLSPGQFIKDFTDLFSTSTLLLFHNFDTVYACAGFYFSLRAPPSFI